MEGKGVFKWQGSVFWMFPSESHLVLTRILFQVPKKEERKHKDTCMWMRTCVHMPTHTHTVTAHWSLLDKPKEKPFKFSMKKTLSIKWELCHLSQTKKRRMFISQKINAVFVAKGSLTIFNMRLNGMVPMTVSLAPDLPDYFPLSSTSLLPSLFSTSPGSEWHLVKS